MPSLQLPILARIISFADLETLLYSCRPAALVLLTAVDMEIEERLKDTIGWFARDVEEMRTIMRSNGVFVGGSLPLTLFSPVKFTPSNANLFVAASRKDALIGHLVHSEGYSIAALTAITPVALPTDPAGDTAVVAYGAGLSDITHLRRGTKHVQVMVFPDPADEGNRFDVVTVAWSTVLFNVVTADFAACGYPTLTLLGRGLFHMERFLTGMPGGSSDHLLNDYAARGFEFSGHPSWWFRRDDEICGRGWTCPLSRRRFGDAGCLIVPTGGGPGSVFGREWVFGGVSSNVHEQ